MDERQKIIISAGGTGGHLFPAQSLAIELMDKGKEVLFVGGGLRKNHYFDRNFPFEEIDCATFSWRQPLKVIRGGMKIVQGVVKSRKVIKRFAPDLIVGFGSFYTLPLLLGALSCKIPFFLHEQNAIPGKVNRLFAPLAEGIALTFPEAASYLKGKTFLTSLPVKSGEEREAYHYFSLDEKKLTLLIFGGSQGAKKINSLFLGACEELKCSLSEFQVIHLTGDKIESSKAKEIYEKLNISSFVTEFEKNIHLAWKIAHMTVQRAGANSICESITYTTPALLIPYPRATEDHQTKNGCHFTQVVRGGEMLSEEEATPKLVAHHILKMVQDLGKIKKQIAVYKESNPRPPFTKILLGEQG